MNRWQHRSRLSRGGRLLAAVAFGLLAIGALTTWDELGALSWPFFGVAVAGLAGTVFWRAQDELDEEQRAFVEAAQQALEEDIRSLEKKRADFAKAVLAYGEFMEYPDFQLLEPTDWGPGKWTDEDEAVRRLVDAETEKVLRKFTEGEYWEGGSFQQGRLMADGLAFIESVARVYRPDAERPLLETNLESLLKAVNRASLQIILLIEELPLVDVKELNLRRVSDGVRTAGKVYRKYEELQPILEPVRYLWQGSKFLFAANPLLAAGWIAGSELAWKGGKKIGKKMLDAYLLSLVKQSLGILAWETATVFDRSHRYRDADWVFAVELAHLVSLFPLTPEALREVLKILGAVPLRSSFDRVFLYRCVSQGVSPKPQRFAQPELLDDQTKRQILTRLTDFREKHVRDLEPEKAHRWRGKLCERLGLAVESPDGSGSLGRRRR